MKYTIALTGNPNSGKTTLFNELTGSSQHVGNWPGVTVEKKEGRIRSDKETTLVDLPGIYSLSPYALEEVIARDYLLNQRPDAIINIIDASNLERNLYLTTQIIELGIPTVVALNMMDLVRRNGDRIDTKKLSQFLGVPVIEISALRKENLDELVRTAHALAEEKKAPKALSFFPEDVEALLSDIEKALPSMSYAAERKAIYEKAPARWTAIKLFEQDEKVAEDIALSTEIKEKIAAVEDAYDDDAQTIISAARYQYIEQAISASFQKAHPNKKTRTEKIDAVVTNRFLAFPIFALIIFLVYYIAVTTVGTIVTDFTNDTFVGEWIQAPVVEAMENAGVSEWLVGLIGDGIIAGVGAVLGFLPQMAILFLLLAFLELSGYMSRIAFILDRIFRRFGLSGKSFIPMLIGTGCAIPGIMASRTIENNADRRMTAITTSFMPCGAKLPIIALFSGVIFGGEWWVGPSCYFLGIAAVIFSGIILKKTRRFAGDPAPFVMELPEYRLPTLKGILLTVWERVWSFIKKAGTIILLSSIVLWFLQAYGFTEEGLVSIGEDTDKSILAAIGNTISWIFAPLGFGDWESTVATVTGLIAKENVVNTFGVLFGIAEEAVGLVEEGDWEALSPIAAHYTVYSGYAFLMFNLLCAPCFAAIGAMNRELGQRRWTLFGVAYQTVLAYSAALVFYQTAMFLTGGGFTIWTVFAAIVLVIWLYFLLRKPRTVKEEL